VRQILRKLKNYLYKPYFFVFKIRIPLDVMYCENLEDFTKGNSRKIIKIVKETFVWAFIIRR